MLIEVLWIMQWRVERMAQSLMVPCWVLLLLQLSPKGLFRLYMQLWSAVLTYAQTLESGWKLQVHEHPSDQTCHWISVFIPLAFLVFHLFRRFPDEFGIFLNHFQALHLNNKPDYPSLHLFIHEDYQYEKDHCERPVCFLLYHVSDNLNTCTWV